MISPFQQQATITKKLQLSPHVFEFTFQLANEITFTPGQYATFIINSQTRRQYSFAAPCISPKEFEIVVDVTPMGPGSTFFLSKKVGDVVDVLAPLGTFHLDTPTTSVVFIATGTGIVPFRTMIEDYLTHGGTENIFLYWGLRYEEDIFWKNMLDEWQTTYSNFHYSIILSKPSDAWQGKIGHVTEYIQEEVQGIKTHTFYLCGNKNMVSEVREKLKTAGIPDTRVKFELF